MKEIGLMIFNKEMVKKFGQMDQYLKDLLIMESSMVMEIINGLMVLHILASGKIIRFVEKVFIVGPMADNIMANG